MVSWAGQVSTTVWILQTALSPVWCVCSFGSGCGLTFLLLMWRIHRSSGHLFTSALLAFQHSFPKISIIFCDLDALFLLGIYFTEFIFKGTEGDTHTNMCKIRFFFRNNTYKDKRSKCGHVSLRNCCLIFLPFVLFLPFSTNNFNNKPQKTPSYWIFSFIMAQSGKILYFIVLFLLLFFPRGY